MTAQPISNEDIFKLLTDIAKSNSEIKQEIKDLRNNLNNEIVNLKTKCIELQEINQTLTNRVLAAERKLKKYNLIIYGVQGNELQTNETVLKLINQKLKISCNKKDIRDIYRIGNKIEGKARPVVIEVLNYELKIEILKNAKTEAKILKDCGVYFSQDYTPDDYEKRKFLYKHLQLARGKHYDARIKNNELVINGESYTYEYLKKTEISDEQSQDTEEINNIYDLETLNSAACPKNIRSAPNTPTTEANLEKVANTLMQEERRRKLSETPNKPTGTKPKTRADVKRNFK